MGFDHTGFVALAGGSLPISLPNTKPICAQLVWLGSDKLFFYIAED